MRWLRAVLRICPFGVASVLVVGLEANVTSSPHLSVGEVPSSSTRAYPAFSLGAEAQVSGASLRVGPTLGPHSEQ